MLADAMLMRIHFVARAKNGNNKDHILIGSSTRKTHDILKETSHNLSQAWGNLLFIVEKVRAMKEGTYLFLRSGDNQGIRIYDIPAEAKIEEEDRENDDN